MVAKTILTLTDQIWEKIVEKGNKPVFVMFYSDHCSFCQQMEPYFNGYAQEFKEKILFAKVDITQNPMIIQRYGIMGTPTFKFFCHGHPIQELSGAVYPTLLKKLIEDGLSHGSECEQQTTWIDSSITGYT